MYISGLGISFVQTPSSQHQDLCQNKTVAVITLLSLAYQDFPEQESIGARALWVTVWLTYVWYHIGTQALTKCILTEILDKTCLQMPQWADRLVGILVQHFAWQELCIIPSKMNGRFCIGLPKMHARFCNGLPKVPGRFCIVPPQVSNSICSHQISTVWEFWCTMAIMQEKQQNHQNF